MDYSGNQEESPFEAILLLGKLLGLSRSMAVVFALLYSVDKALTSEEIVERSHLSKSAVSMALRDLLQLGAIREQSLLGERSRRYSGQPDLGQVAALMVFAKFKYPLLELRDKLDGLSDAQPRLDQVRALLETVTSTLAELQS